MPTNSERVVNRPLSGDELKILLRADFERLLASEGMLSPHIAFGRIAYTIDLRLHMDNFVMPESHSTIASRPPAVNVLPTKPELAAVEAMPLAEPSPKVAVGATRLTRSIDSPNAERLRNGLPVPVEVTQQDSTRTTQHITYPPDAFPELGGGDVKIADVSVAVARDIAAKG